VLYAFRLKRSSRSLGAIRMAFDNAAVQLVKAGGSRLWEAISRWDAADFSYLPLVAEHFYGRVIVERDDCIFGAKPFRPS